jgi:type II secretory pathway component PulJ
MREDEHGLSTIALIVSILIISMIALGAMMTIFQVIRVTAQSDSHMTALQQVQNAGFWISRDARMADNVTTENLGGTNFLVLCWTEVDDDDSDNTTEHSATYFFEELSGGIGILKRNYSSSAGLNNETLVAQHIYYDPDDPANTSNVSYTSPSLTLKLVAIFDDASETREYQVSCRPKL